MRHFFLTVAVALATNAIAAQSPARDSATPTAIISPAGLPLAQALQSPTFARLTASDTTVVASWTFDDGMGGANPQNWTSFDRTEPGANLYFHVDDFAGLNAADYAPIQGARSLWCGARPCATPEVCNYLTLPGYGNLWDERFESVPFTVSGDVTVDFFMRWDTEPSYDKIFLEYSAGAGPWQLLGEFDGHGSGFASQHITQTIPAANHAGSVRVRFHFVSDMYASDEDAQYNTNGAAIIDDILVSDATGTVDSQNFESEPVGAIATGDGHWTATSKAPFGDYAGLVDGTMVLQEDSVTTDASHFWGFFNGSTDTYACGGHTEQTAVPLSKTINGDTVYIHDEIRSPPVSISGVDPSHAILLAFDVYADLPVQNQVYFEYRVRSFVDFQ
jgi:hypothetical protein